MILHDGAWAIVFTDLANIIRREDRLRKLGVEEELLLVDGRSQQPVAVAGTLLRFAADDSDLDVELAAELQQQQIEVDTRPTRDLAELAEQLRHGRQQADTLAARIGARIAALATSPLPATPQTTPTMRYAAMVEHFGLTTAEQLTCGCHVHVEVASEEEGIGVLDRIRVWLPALLALSANSPFWQGRDTGYASYRTPAWYRWPSAGPAPVWGSAAAYSDQLQQMVATGVLLDAHMAYFDARLSDRYPTVEVRVADVCLELADTVLVAGLARALVETAAREWREGQPVPDVSVNLLRLATWRAARSGLDGPLLDPRTYIPRIANAVVQQLIAHVAPALRDSGDLELVEQGWRELTQRGTGAARQRQVAQQDGDLAEVVRQAVARTTSGELRRWLTH